MTDNIIALVDDSGYATSVCEHAAWVSHLTGAPVQLLHVMGRREAAGPQDLSGAIRLGARTALLEELATLDAQRARIANEAGRALLEDARQLTEGAGATAVTTRLEQGDLIDRAVGHEAPDTRLIVIGKRGAAADFAKGHLGSNLERIVRSARKPVLVASRSFKPIRKVLVAFDGGNSALKAVQHIATSPVFKDLQIELAMAGNSGNNARDTLDEWIYFLKNSEIKQDFTAKGIREADEVLRRANMSDQERRDFQRFVEVLSDRASAAFTIEFEATRRADEIVKEAEKKAKAATEQAEKKAKEATERAKKAKEATEQAEKKAKEAEEETRRAKEEAEKTKEEAKKAKQEAEDRIKNAEEQVKRNVVINLLPTGLSDEQIAEVAQVSVDFVRRVKQDHA